MSRILSKEEIIKDYVVRSMKQIKGKGGKHALTLLALTPLAACGSGTVNLPTTPPPAPAPAHGNRAPARPGPRRTG